MTSEGRRPSNVLLLKGGRSAEREVSLLTAEAVQAALSRLGYHVKSVDVLDPSSALRDIIDFRADVVFNALHGKQGEDGCVQGLLNLLGLPYTHSGVLASAMAMDKTITKRLLKAAGLRTPGGGLFTREELSAGEPLPRPYIVKPNDDGSSKGIFIIKPEDPADAHVFEDWPFGESALVEDYVPGRELTVAVLDDRPLAVTELIAKNEFYDYEAKYSEGVTKHIIPADVPGTVYQAALEQAVTAHRAVGARSLTRTDFRYRPDQMDDQWHGLYILEINTQPGMTDLSLAPEQARHCGISFDELVDHLVRTARAD